jgi:site-specific recombinase XerD
LNGLLDTCANDVVDIRDAAVIAVLYGCELRRGEVVALVVKDDDQVEQALRVKCKRNKERLAPVSGGVAGADIVTAQKLAGHANVETTARYDRRGEQSKRRAVELLHVPHRKQEAAENSGG